MTLKNQIKWLLKRNNNRKRVKFGLLKICYFNFNSHISKNNNKWPKFFILWLKELKSEKLIRFPKKEELWEKYLKWEIPKYVTIEDKNNGYVEDAKKEDVLWCPLLSFIPNLSIRHGTVKKLKKMNETLIQKPESFKEKMTLRERSLQIFNNEKILPKLAKRQWFKKNLSLDDLNCYKTQIPFVSVYFYDAITSYALIIENLDTFDAFCEANRIESQNEDNKRTKSYYKLMIFGNGLDIKEKIGMIQYYSEIIEKIYYFGDIDFEGLEIPYFLKKYIEKNFPKMDFLLAKEYYSKIVQGKRNNSKDKRKIKNMDWLSIFSEKMREDIIELNNKRMKIPQENLKKKEIKQMMKSLIKKA